MERYCSTGQSPQRAVAPKEEEEYSKLCEKVLGEGLLQHNEKERKHSKLSAVTSTVKKAATKQPRFYLQTAVLTRSVLLVPAKLSATLMTMQV